MAEQKSASSTRLARAWRSQRAVFILWTTVFALFFASVALMLPRLFVRYGEVIPPETADLCPGELLRYSVLVEITHFPGEATISEGWCRAGVAGTCANSLAKTTTIPLAGYRRIAANPAVPIPASSFFRAGDYEYWHVAVNGRADGYTVPFTIRDDCPPVPPATTP